MLNEELVNVIQHLSILYRIRARNLGITAIKGIESAP